MLPPQTTQLMNDRGHDTTTPEQHGAHNLPDDVLVDIATVEHRVIVTENASDFATVRVPCPVRSQVMVATEIAGRATRGRPRPLGRHQPGTRALASLAAARLR